MVLNRTMALSLVAVGVLVLGGSAQANLLSNPSYVSGSGGWTGITRWYNGGTMAPLPHTGEPFSDPIWCAQAAGYNQPFVYQSVTGTTFQSGYIYDYYAWLGANYSTTTTVSIGYFSGAPSEANFVTVDSVSGSNSTWTKVSGSYAASGGAVGQTVVYAWKPDDAGATSWVDDSSLTEVPEPATMGLLALGGVGLLLRRRRR